MPVYGAIRRVDPGRKLSGGLCLVSTKRAVLRKKTSTKSPGEGQVKEGNLTVCCGVNPAVTAPGPAGTDAVPPAESAVLAYTSTLHHVKGF